MGTLVAYVGARLVLGLVIGFCIGLTGIGGGVLVLPSLTILLGLPPSAAVGTASLYAFLTKCYAAYRHFRLKTVARRLSFVMLAGAVPGTFVAAFFINRCVTAMEGDVAALQSFQGFLKNFMAVVVLLAAAILTLNLVTRWRAASKETRDELHEKLTRRPILRDSLAVAVGALVGTLIGSTSIGGGVIVVPLLMIFFGLTASQTVGTSIFVAVVLTLAASIVYGTGSQIDAATALIMAVGSLSGVYVGTRLSVRVPERLLRGVLVAVIIIAGIAMLLKQGNH
jgi:uncharacterized membrane protein YfcA